MLFCVCVPQQKNQLHGCCFAYPFVNVKKQLYTSQLLGCCILLMRREFVLIVCQIWTGIVFQGRGSAFMRSVSFSLSVLLSLCLIPRCRCLCRCLFRYRYVCLCLSSSLVVCARVFVYLSRCLCPCLCLFFLLFSRGLSVFLSLALALPYLAITAFVCVSQFLFQFVISILSVISLSLFDSSASTTLCSLNMLLLRTLFFFRFAHAKDMSKLLAQ